VIDLRGTTRSTTGGDGIIIVDVAARERAKIAFARARAEREGREKSAEHTIIGKELGDEEKLVGACSGRPGGANARDSRIMDSQQSTIEATTRAAQHAVTIEQQIAEICEEYGCDRSAVKFGIE
jgi:hypothetical protein